MSFQELKSKPQLLDCDDAQVKKLETDSLDMFPLSFETAKKNCEKFLKTKYFPAEIRGRLWPMAIENKASINPRFFKLYADLIIAKRKENEAFGSTVVIRQHLQASISRLSISEDDSFVESAVLILLVFEFFQPNIGYCLGMEKLVLFLRKLFDEATTFLLFYNMLFNSRFIWSYYEAKKTITEQYLELLDRLVSQSSTEAKRSFECNQAKLQRFFLVHAPTMYLEVFDPPTIE